MVMFSSSRLAALQEQRNTPNVQQTLTRTSAIEPFLGSPPLEEQAEQPAGADGDLRRARVSLHHLHHVDVETTGQQQRTHLACKKSKCSQEKKKKTTIPLQVWVLNAHCRV